MAEAVEAPEGEKKKKKGKKALLIPVVVMIIGLGAGGFFFLKPAEKSEAAVDPNVPTTIVEGVIVRLPPITLNLTDGHVLKVEMALQMVKEPKHEELKAIVAALAAAGHSGKASDPNPSPLAGEEAKALDAAIALLGDKTYEELSKPGAKTKAKEELSKKIEHIYHGDITKVYFTDFVMS